MASAPIPTPTSFAASAQQPQLLHRPVPTLPPSWPHPQARTSAPRVQPSAVRAAELHQRPLQHQPPPLLCCCSCWAAFRRRGQQRGSGVLVPVVRVTGVLPQARTVKLDGALMSYHSFFRKGSSLRAAGRAQEDCRPQLVGQSLDSEAPALRRRVEVLAGAVTHTFFPLPFLPLDRRLFLPTACHAEGRRLLRHGPPAHTAARRCWLRRGRAEAALCALQRPIRLLLLRLRGCGSRAGSLPWPDWRPEGVRASTRGGRLSLADT